MAEFKLIDMGKKSIKKKNNSLIDFFQNNKIVSMFGVLAVLLFFMGIIVLFINYSPAQNQAVQIIPSEENNNEEEGGIYVDLSGAVQRPGLYHISSNSRINDLLAAAGGLSAEADRDWVAKSINLAQKLTDGIKIYIPFAKESKQSGLLENIDNLKVNINFAGQSELEALPGIGPVMAQKIIDYRDKNGLFTDLEELKNTPGIGDKTYESLKELITVY